MWLSRFLVVLIVFALCTPVDAQQAKKVHRIGFLMDGFAPSFPVRVAASARKDCHV